MPRPYLYYMGQPPAAAPARQLVIPRGMPSDPANFARFRTQMRERPEDIWQPLYDRVNFLAAGQFEVAWFANPLGSSVTLIQAGASVTKIKTFRDTNLPNQGVLPAKAFQIHGFALHYVPVQQAVGAVATASIVDDIARLMNGGFLEVRLIDKPYLFLPLHRIPDPGSIRAFMATTATATTIVAPAGPGTGSPRDIWWITPPLTIDPYQNFVARGQFDGSPAIGQTNDMALFLEGFTRRPGQ